MRFSNLLTTLTLMGFVIGFGAGAVSADDKYGKKSNNDYGNKRNYDNNRKGYGVNGNDYKKNSNDYKNNYQNNDYRKNSNNNRYENNNNRNDYRRDSDRRDGGNDYRQSNDNRQNNNNFNWNRNDWNKFQSKYRHFDKDHNKYYYNKKHDNNGKHWWSSNNGYRFDNNVVHDRHGHSIGRYSHVSIKPSWGWILPHVSAQYNGTYYYDSGRYYYYPQTYSTDPNVYASAEPQPLQFGGYAYTSDLAARLEVATNELCLDMYYNYRQNPGFNEIYQETYQLLQLAKYLRSQNAQGDRQAMAEQVGGMDALIHYLAESTESWRRVPTRQVGETELGSKLEIVDSTLHHLMFDMGVPLTETSSDDIAPGPIDDQAPLPGSF